MTITAIREGSPFDAIRRTREDGAEYWSARDLMPLLGYPEWREFRPAVERAWKSAEAQGHAPEDLFGVITEKGLGRPREDVHLSRFACYLVAMNGDPRKPEVAAAQAYFAEEAREAEVAPTHFAIPKTYAEALRAAADADEARALTAEAKIAEAEREEKARRMHREVTLLFEHDPIGRLIAALLIAREGSDR